MARRLTKQDEEILSKVDGAREGRKNPARINDGRLHRIGRRLRKAALAVIGRDEDWGYREFNPPAAALGWLGYALVLAVDYTIVSFTATNVLPGIAATLHQSVTASGAEVASLSTEGLVALYIVPLVFVALVILAGELVLMRGMWRLVGRLIARSRARRADKVAHKTAAPTAAARETKRNNNRKAKRQ